MKTLTANEIEAIYEKHFGKNTFSNYIIRDGTQALLDVLLNELEEEEETK